MNPWRQALAILAASTLVRLVLASVVPLLPDETYYWEWSRQLAGGYFDHPPVIAWLIAGGTALLGHTPLGVRLLPVLLGSVAGFFLIRAACHLAGERAARFIAIAFAVMPLSAAGLVLATPDAPLLAFLAWTTWGVVAALDDEGPATNWWVVAGLAIGLAMTSKFTGVLFPLAILIAMLTHPALRRRIGTRGPWIAVGVASCVMIPVLVWNAQHEWISFRFQLGHGLGPARAGANSIAAILSREGALLGGQAGLLTPILFVLLCTAIWRGLRVGRVERDGIRWTLAVISLFCLAFFVYSATRKSVEANWPAIAWVPALLLLAMVKGRSGDHEERGAAPVRSPWERRALWLAGGLTAILLLHVVRPILPLSARRDQLSKAFGWERVAASVDSATGSRFLATNRYQDAAMLAFHLDAHPRVFALNLRARRNQYDLWPRFTDVAAPGADLLLVLEEPAQGIPVPIQLLDPHFASIAPGALIEMRRDTAYVGRRRLWTLRGWVGSWPVDSTDPLAKR